MEGEIQMQKQYFKIYSEHLNRDMEFKVYGHTGKPVLVFPSQDGRFFDFENFKMLCYYLETFFANSLPNHE